MKNVVFGKNVHLKFSDGTSEVKLFDVQGFDFSQDDKLVINKMLGEAGRGTAQVIDNGGSCNFNGKHTDPALIAFLVRQSQQVRGDGDNLGKSGKQPYIKIEIEITYHDNSICNLTFEGLVIYGLNGSITDSDTEVDQRIQGSYERINISFGTTGIGSAGGIGKDAADTALSNYAKLAIRTAIGGDEFANATNVPTNFAANNSAIRFLSS